MLNIFEKDKQSAEHGNNQTALIGRVWLQLQNHGVWSSSFTHHWLAGRQGQTFGKLLQKFATKAAPASGTSFPTGMSCTLAWRHRVGQVVQVQEESGRVDRAYVQGGCGQLHVYLCRDSACTPPCTPASACVYALTSSSTHCSVSYKQGLQNVIILGALYYCI